MAGNLPFWGEKKSRSIKHTEALGAGSNIQVAFVRDATDPQRMGRLVVWVPDFGPDLPASYVTVSYASPFAGTTNINDAKDNDKTEEGSQRSYGFWAIPPDIGNQVLVAFVNGDLSRGFWFGCIFPQNMDHMVPGIGSNKSTDDSYNEKFSPFSPPVVEYNKKDQSIDPKNAIRPVDKALADGLLAQGLAHDPERGITNSSARREEKSLVQGLLTPGGSSIVLDDNPDDSFIRFRTKSGTQIMVSETSGFIYMITKGGNSWIEMSDGAIDIFSVAPISMRSEDDINIRADKNLNLDAGENINLHAGGNISSYAGGNTDMAAGGHFVTQAGGKASHSAGSTMAVGAGATVGITAGGDVVNEAGGNVVNRGAQILDNAGGGAAPSTSDAQIKEATSVGGPPNICSRLPTHEPFDHPINASNKSSAFGVGGTGTGTITDSEGRKSTGVIQPDNSTVRNISGFKVSDKVNNCILQASQKTGVPYANLMAIAGQESTFRATAGAGSSSAKGLFQFVDGTWADTYAKYGPNGTVVKNPSVQDNVYDPCSNALMGAYYYKANAASLSAAGLPTDATAVYITHFLGTGGGKSLLRGVQSNPNGPANASSKAISKNRSIFYTSSGQLRTNQQVYDLLYSKVGSTVPQWQKYQNSKTGG